MFSRKTTFLTALIEAALVVAVSLGILVVPFTVLWAVENNSTVDWMAAYRASADIWLAAQGVPIEISAQTIAGVAAPAFLISILPLGYTAVMVGMTYRMGQRLATSRALWPGWLGAGSIYLIASMLISLSAKHSLAAPMANLGTYLPPLLFMVVLMAASLFAKPTNLGLANEPVSAEREVVHNWLRTRWENLGWWANVVIPPAARAGTAVVVILVGFAALVLSLLLAVNWIEVIRLYEGLQLTLLGGVMVTIGQVAFLPNFVIYTADWFTGAGFVLGSGSLASPLGTNLGPLPSLPVLAALPVGHLSFGLVAVLVPVIAAIVATISIKSHAGAMRHEFAQPVSAALSLGIPVALVAAVEFLVLNLLARGSLGPGRFFDVGGNPLTTAGALFIEVAVVSTIAAFYTANPDAPDAKILERARTSVVTKASRPKAEDLYDTTAPAKPRPMTSGFEPED